ncbi:MAG: response regulator [Clostridiaceae bacterium]|nr:response regulator [Clostridiaceae bacterium]
MQQRNTILIADDQEVNRMILKHIFSEQYAIVEAKDGVEAIEQVEKYQGELVLILLDLVMPRKDGFGVMEYLTERELADRIPTILITSDTSLTTELKGYEHKVADIVTKPFNLQIVMRRVTNIIELYSHKRNLEAMVHAQLLHMEEQYYELQSVNDELKNAYFDMCGKFCNLITDRELQGDFHTNRVQAFVKILYRYMMTEYPEYNLSRAKQEKVVRAAAFYDIGKITIPESILFKPGALTEEEYQIMQTHTIAGRGLVQDLACLDDEETLQYALDICHYHHERYDGSGYPEQKKGDDIPIAAQIVSIAEAYAALLRKGSYRDAYSQVHAEKMILDGECGVYNPKLLDCFELAKEEMRALFINQN